MLGAGQRETTVIIVISYTHPLETVEEKKKRLTKFKRITQGVTTSAAETAEMKRGGSL